MGCTSSREAKLGRRSNSMPAAHRLKGDSLHVVSLTFSTLGSLRLESTHVSSEEDSAQNPKSEIINSWELVEDSPNPALSASSGPFPYWIPQSPQFLSTSRKAKTEEIPKFPGIVKARVAAFQQRIDARRASFRKGKVVLFLTSLRGVRKTYEDCLNAKAILQSYGVRIDERDVSMHAGFREELNQILGTGAKKLPRVFVNGGLLGGEEEVKRMHENGELAEALKHCERVEEGFKACEACGDYRFVPCKICSGSCKVYVRKEEDEEGEEEEGEGFKRCLSCNENGLVRCPLCC